MTVHIAKNYMELPKIKVPLILGIWGGKGQGKTFQCMLAYKKLGINPIVMSAGVLPAPKSRCLFSPVELRGKSGSTTVVLPHDEEYLLLR